MEAQIVEEQPEDGYEEGIGERLRTHDRGAGPVRDEHRQSSPGHRARRAAQPPGEHGGACEAQGHEQRVYEHYQREPAETVEPVEPELREPLLVDPGSAVRPDRERVVRGEPVLGHHPSRKQCHPPVGRQSGAEVGDQGGGEGRDHDDDGAVLLEHAPDAGKRGLPRLRAAGRGADRLLVRVQRHLMQAPAADA